MDKTIGTAHVAAAADQQVPDISMILAPAAAQSAPVLRALRSTHPATLATVRRWQTMGFGGRVAGLPEGTEPFTAGRAAYALLSFEGPGPIMVPAQGAWRFVPLTELRAARDRAGLITLETDPISVALGRRQA